MARNIDGTKGHEAITPLARLKNTAYRHKKKIIGSIIAPALVGVELNTSFLQANYFHYIATESKTTLVEGNNAINTQMTRAPSGPYNVRYGYTRAEEFADNLQRNGYQLTARAAHIAPQILGHDLYPLYKEKSQAGLCITDEFSNALSRTSYPAAIYNAPSDIADTVQNSLLLVENRELSYNYPDTHSPVIEWGPFTKALGFKLLEKAGLDVGKVSAGSTLITQRTKARHSKGGQTSSEFNKLEQMLSASVSAYADDMNTKEDIPHLIQDYFNSIPFTAHPKLGEIIGFADAMAVWFGNDFDDMNKLLNTPEDQINDEDFDQYAQYYLESLALIMAVQRPDAYLVQDRSVLKDRLDKFLPFMADKGVISPRLRDAAMNAQLDFNDSGIDMRPRPTRPDLKARTILENKLMTQFGMSNMYAFRHIDACATTTLNLDVTKQISDYLQSLSNPQTLVEEELSGVNRKRANPDLAEDIIYGVTLYRGGDLIVQSDTYSGQLDISEGTKVELGSVAKLRTLITYLEIIEKMHHQYAAQSIEDLQAIGTDNLDQLSAWTIQNLITQGETPALKKTLNAAMNKEYSADHRRGFRTDGGIQRYQNYNFLDYKKKFTVSEALHQSSNLPWVRIIKDIADHIIAVDLNLDQGPADDRKLTQGLYGDLNHPARAHYLNKFIKNESQIFLSRFNRAFYRNNTRTADHILTDAILTKRDLSLDHLAVIHTSLYPDQTLDDYRTFVDQFKQHKHIQGQSDSDISETYYTHRDTPLSLKEKGFLTGLHPIQIWVAQNYVSDPKTKARSVPDDVLQASYAWLLDADVKSARDRERIFKRQNSRIHRAIEKDAFKIIHASWAKQGFPFDELVPSYASVLGSSADTPAATAELIGAIQNGGAKHSPRSFTDVTIAQDTVYEQRFDRTQAPVQQIMSPEIASIALKALEGVVKDGTARLAHNSIKLSDGRTLKLAGKTGTHDGEARRWDAVSGKMETVKHNRIAVFTFSIGDPAGEADSKPKDTADKDHFYGTITVAVLGDKAKDHKFTSSLAVKLLSNIAPMLKPVLDPAHGISPQQTMCARQKSDYALGLGLNENGQYKIKVGDNLHHIAQLFRDKANDNDITVEAIKTANTGNYPNLSTPTLVAEKEIHIPFKFSCDI